MEHVIKLKQNEGVQVNSDRLEELYRQLGQSGAEDVVCRTLEELAARLSHTERCFRELRYEDMRKSARGLVAISEQIGMSLVAQVALDVTQCIDAGDGIALSATMARLLRIGERSLMEIWELQDLSI